MKKNFENVEFSDYENNFSDSGFWAKMKKIVSKAGSKVIYAALRLYYAAQSDDTPVWAKSVIYGALGYLILPIDMIPDTIPVIGLTDDFALITAALATVAVHITADVNRQARDKMKTWFGNEELDQLNDQIEEQ